jgi:hypothetical protein
MVIAIEPMLSAGSDRIRTLSDRWTVVTDDNSLSAHFEHTVAITDDGPRILTAAAVAGPASGARTGMDGSGMDGSGARRMERGVRDRGTETAGADRP